MCEPGLSALATLIEHFDGDLAVWSESLSALLGMELTVCDVTAPRGSNGKAHGMTDTLMVSVKLADGAGARLYLKAPEEGLYAETLLSDRLREVAWRMEGYPTIPQHVTCAATAWITPSRTLRPTGMPTPAGGVCVVEWETPGQPYHERLVRLEAEPAASRTATADSLCDYLVALHSPVAGDHRSLYNRMLRDTLMNAVFRLIDGAREFWDDHAEQRLEVERLFVEWRTRLSQNSERLRRTHNDFHPWNILLDGDCLRVIGARLPGMGDPAEDLAALLVNYVWFSYLRNGDFTDPYRAVYKRVWQRYLDQTGDDGCASVFAPFLAKRLLVLMSPVYYPDQPPWLVGEFAGLVPRLLRGEVDALSDPAALSRAGA